MALVELRGVTKVYRKGDQTITPLDGVDLDVEKGDLLSLMGASGTGKSTFLNLIETIFPIRVCATSVRPIRATPSSKRTHRSPSTS